MEFETKNHSFYHTISLFCFKDSSLVYLFFGANFKQRILSFGLF